MSIIKKQKDMSFADMAVQRRIRKNTFFKMINTIIDWKPIEKELLKIRKTKMKNAAGNPAYNPIILFKMMLLQTWYSMSDESVEEMVNENLSAMDFCGLVMEDEVPDHSTLSRFRKELTEKKALDRLLRKINKQLEEKKLKVKTGVVVDASITESPLSPKGKTTYEIAQDRKEDERADKEKDKEAEEQVKLQKIESPGVDGEARWLQKGKKFYYGYKRHDATNEQGLIEAVHTVAANEHDSKGLEPLLEKVEKAKKQKGVFTDKGYKVPANDALLKEGKMKNRIMHKAYRNRPLTYWQKEFNKLVSKKRYVVERTFGGMKRWFGAGTARYRGIEKMHSQHVIEAIAYNLKRSPGLVCQMAKN